MRKPIKIALLLIITLYQIKSEITCEELNCKICCTKNIEGINYCSETELTCKLNSSKILFDSLIYSFIIFFGIIFGIPLTLFFFNILFLKKIGILKVSLCEFFFSSICLCSFFRKIRRKKIIFEDKTIKYDFDKKNSKVRFNDTSLINLKIT